MDSSFLHPSGSASTGGASASATTPTPTTVPSTNTATLVANNSVGGGAASTGVKRAHASSNAISNKSRSAANYPRKRAVSACLVCRGRKTKCDNQRPQCGFCKQTGAECVYEAEKLATFDAASLAILDKLSKIEAMLDSDRSSSNQQHTPTSHPSSHTSVSTTSGGAGPIPALPTLATCGSSPKSKAQPDASEIFPVCIATASGSRVEAVLQWPIFSGQFCVEDILAPVFENSHAEDDEDEDERDTWQERKGMMGRSKPEDGYQGHGGSVRKGTGLYDYDEKLLRQPPGEILTLVQRFFRNVHTKNPILDSAVLDGYAYEIEQHGFGWSGKSCLVLLVCALGSISAPYNPNPSSLSVQDISTKYPSPEISARYFSAAKKRLGIVLSSNKLIAVQCLFLAGIYHMYTMNQFAAWKMFNAASVSCEGYLHRKENSKASDGAHSGMFSSCSNEPTRHLEQRIYWSCLKSELELCSQLDTSHSGLNEVDYPHAFPSPPREISTSAAFQSSTSFFEQPRSAQTLTSSQSQPTSTTTGIPEDRQEDELTWFYYLAEIALRKVELSMSEIFSPPPPHPPSHSTSSSNASTPPALDDPPSRPIKLEDLLSSAHEFELQLELWYSYLPSVLKFPPDPRGPCHDERLQYLRQRYWFIASMVYRPFLYYLIHHHPPHSTLPQQPHLARIKEYARKGLEIDANFILSNVITHRHHGAWLTIRAITTNSLVLGAARMAGMRMPEGWREAVTAAKNCLVYWESEVRDAGALKGVVEKVERQV